MKSAMETTIRNPEAPCCGKQLDAMTAVHGDSVPEEGDLTVCIYCYAWLILESGALRRMRGDEVIALDNKTHLLMQRVANAARDRGA